MILTAVSLPSSCQPRDTGVVADDHPLSDSCPTSTLLARKRASVHIIEGSTSAKRISLIFRNSRCRSLSESWAFLSASSGVSPIDEREGVISDKGYSMNTPNSNNNNVPSSLSTLRLSSLRPAEIDCDSSSTSSSPISSCATPTPNISATPPSPTTTAASPTAVASTIAIASVTEAEVKKTETKTEASSSFSSSLSEIPPSSMNLFRQPAVTGATPYEDLPDQELLKTLAAFLRGGSDKASNCPSTASRLNQNNDDSAVSDLGKDFILDYSKAAGIVPLTTQVLVKMKLMASIAKTITFLDKPDGMACHYLISSPSSSSTANNNNYNKTRAEGDCGCSGYNHILVTVRDFAYPKSHPYHFGNYPPEPEYEESDIEEDEEYYPEESSDMSIPTAPGAEDEDRTEGYARGLYDFDAENSSELSFKEGEFLYIHCRHFPGWFLGEKDGAQGLVPENYVQLV
ncbi:HOG (high osmolarity glycerol) pathway protein [Linnemannia zychae]|nr:HOG (high osmolarity glycerol) pathway protein [Linnemannia zychae]